MGLTRLRAEQISDIDYKQAVRVITVTNVTLSGGAPSQVDSVNLSAGDRVLVNGQSTGSQNGIYEVETVGTGSNGTWVRSTDTNATGELEAGTIVMVTEGTVYKDTQWKLTTNNPIVIGTTALTFEQNSAFAFGNVYANGTAVLANTVGDVLTLTAGNNIEITGNNTTKTVTIGVTGVSTSNISSGNSNVTVVSSGGNVTVGIGGTANVAVFATTGEYVTGVLSASGNVIGGNLLTSGQVSATGNVTGGNIRTAGLISATSTITSAANIVGENISTAGLITATGNITGGNILTVGQVSATGNVTGNFFIGNGAFLTGLSAETSNGISNGATSISIPVSSGNITMSVAGQSNTVIINLGSFTMYGTFAGPKTLEANVAVANAVNAVLFGPVDIGNNFNISVPSASTLYVYSGA